MKVFVDTSAFYASINADDVQHAAAQQTLERLEETGAEAWTTNYVLLECASLIQKRKGFSMAQTFLTKIGGQLEILWIDEPLHKETVSIWAKFQRRGLSLVDCASFAAMRRMNIHRVVAFDKHFSEHGFEQIP